MAVKNLRSEARAQFVELIRREHYQDEVRYMIGASQYGLSRADVDQCVADAFNPSKGYSRPDNRDVKETTVASSSAKQFDWAMLIVYPLMVINGICAFIIMLVFNLISAIVKTCKGRTVD